MKKNGNNSLMSSFSLLAGLKKTLALFFPQLQEIPAIESSNETQDVTIKFLSAENLPKMDFIGTADPYFVAKIDDRIVYTSTVLANTLNPKWEDEEWIVRNIPINAKLTVQVYDKDDDILDDDYIGKFEVTDLANYHQPEKGHSIVDDNGQHQGYFHLTIQSEKRSEESEELPRYTFDGPCRFVRHDSTAFGWLTMINSEAGYSTWKIPLRRLSTFFRPSDLQPWNRQYPIAQAIFSGTTRALAKQHTIKLAHKVLYGRTIRSNAYGRLNNAEDLWKKIFCDKQTGRVRLCFYTYIIDNDQWRFSQTGEGFFTDYASKHALHANCSESVRYAGQFHPRPKNGWDQSDDEWELVFDNWSGTYAPNEELLIKLKELLEFNFPGLNVVTYHFKNPQLQESMNKLKSADEKLKRTSMSLDRLVLAPIIN